MHPVTERSGRDGKPDTDTHTNTEAEPNAEAEADEGTLNDPAHGRMSELDDRRSVTTFAALARPDGANQGMVHCGGPDGRTDCACAHAVDDQDLVEAGKGGIVEVAHEGLQSFVDSRSSQVE